jgi:hypothetical protein
MILTFIIVINTPYETRNSDNPENERTIVDEITVFEMIVGHNHKPRKKVVIQEDV